MVNIFNREFINIKNVNFFLFNIKIVLQNKRINNAIKINNEVFSIILYD